MIEALRSEAQKKTILLILLAIHACGSRKQVTCKPNQTREFVRVPVNQTAIGQGFLLVVTVNDSGTRGCRNVIM